MIDRFWVAQAHVVSICYMELPPLKIIPTQLKEMVFGGIVLLSLPPHSLGVKLSSASIWPRGGDDINA